MLARIKNSRAVRILLPRFSRRRAVAAYLWHGGKACLAEGQLAFALVRRHGLLPALRQMRWRQQAQHKGGATASAAEVPPLHLLPQLLSEAYPDGVPYISIVAPLFAKREELPFFLQTLFRQNYPGQVELVLVDDCCPQNSVETAREEFYRLKSEFPSSTISLKVLHTEKNRGNCHARNLGVEAAKGDIVVILDADCLMNATFLSLHALYMALGPYDALMGPCNLETKHRPPLEALQSYEQSPALVRAEQKPQDSLCPTGFVNSITGNFSIRKSIAPLPLFDEAFSYSAESDSGYGWEDVAMGRTLYDAGLRFGYAEGAFTVHISHEHTVPTQDKALRCLRNFVKLLEKYPDMVDIAGRWVRNTYEAILNIDGEPLAAHTPERQKAERLIGLPATRPHPVPALSPKRLRILSFHWHTSHQYELFKLPHDFFLVRGVGEAFTQNWDIERRPMPDNIRFTNYKEIRSQDYDLAIVPFDENVLAPQNCNGILGLAWGDLFLWFLRNVSLPKIGICHGTPQFYGQYDISYAEPNLMQVIETERLRLVEAVRDFTVVCNSHQAEREWGFVRSTTIWHGFDPMEFPLRGKDSSGCLALGEEVMRHRPFYNGFFVYKETCAQLSEAHSPVFLKTPSPQGSIPKGNFYARAKFRNYVDELRKHVVYFNPTLRSPMPRTRGEAMLCGLVPVSLPNHDADMFIKNGVNGFMGSCPLELREHITFCLENPEMAWKIGLEARKSATALFSLDRYLAEWQALLQTAL